MPSPVGFSTPTKEKEHSSDTSTQSMKRRKSPTTFQSLAKISNAMKAAFVAANGPKSLDQPIKRHLNELPPDISCIIDEIPDRKLPLLLEKRRMEIRDVELDRIQLGYLRTMREGRIYLNSVPVYGMIGDSRETQKRTPVRLPPIQQPKPTSGGDERNQLSNKIEHELRNTYEIYSIPYRTPSEAERQNKNKLPKKIDFSLPAPKTGPYALVDSHFDKGQGRVEVDRYQIQDKEKMRAYRQQRPFPRRVGTTVHSEWRRLRYKSERDLSFGELVERVQKAKYNAILQTAQRKKGNVGIGSVKLTSLNVPDNTTVDPTSTVNDQKKYGLAEVPLKTTKSDEKPEDKEIENDNKRSVLLASTRKQTLSELRHSVKPYFGSKPAPPRKSSCFNRGKLVNIKKYSGSSDGSRQSQSKIPKRNFTF